MIITDFFATTAALKEFIRGISIDTGLESFAPMYRHAAKKLVKLVGVETYDLLAAHVKTPPNPEVPVLDLAVEYVRATLANLLAIAWFNFDAGERNAAEKKLYRYQEDKIIESYLENAWAEFDQLVAHMETDIAAAAASETVPPYATPFTDFEDSDLFMERQDLYITSAAEFDKYYGIDSSSYFYFNAIFIQKEVEEEEITPRVKTIPTITVDEVEVDDPDFLRIIKKAIAFETVARACQRFDYTELPKSLRNDIIKEIGGSVNRNEMGSIKDSLYARLHAKALKYFQDIEFKLKLASATTTPVVPVAINSEDKKFYLTI